MSKIKEPRNINSSARKRKQNDRKRKIEKRQEERMTLGKIGFKQLGRMSITKRTKCIL
jgi:hypothetical protein